MTNRGRSLARRCPPVVASFVPAENVEVASSLADVELGALNGVVGRRSAEWFVTIPVDADQSQPFVLGKIDVRGGTGGDQTVEVTVGGDTL